jgi:hypothetical protein
MGTGEEVGLYTAILTNDTERFITIYENCTIKNPNLHYAASLVHRSYGITKYLEDCGTTFEQVSKIYIDNENTSKILITYHCLYKKKLTKYQ